jgi:hypothetical protein
LGESEKRGDVARIPLDVLLREDKK